MLRKETSDWLKQAKADLKTATHCLDSKDYYACAFFSQQAGEKALKAYYIHAKNDVPTKTHNVYELAIKLKLPERMVAICRRLAPQFVVSRYPDAVGGVPSELYDENGASEVLDEAVELVEWLEKQILR
ncbi:MAG: HEPN domain-containing protein [Candidatus Micrarchaeota archaeon]